MPASVGFDAGRQTTLCAGEQELRSIIESLGASSKI
jgi:hypothetical protein